MWYGYVVLVDEETYVKYRPGDLVYLIHVDDIDDSYDEQIYKTIDGFNFWGKQIRDLKEVDYEEFFLCGQ